MGLCPVTLKRTSANICDDLPDFCCEDFPVWPPRRENSTASTRALRDVLVAPARFLADEYHALSGNRRNLDLKL